MLWIYRFLGQCDYQLKTQDPSVCFPHKTHLKNKDTERLKVKGQRKINHANTNQKKAEMAFLISGKADCRTRKISINKEGHIT